MTGWPFGALRMFGYGVILADPPWLFELRSAKGETKAPQAHYRCMPTEEICALPVGHLASRDCALVLWGITPMLQDALAVLRAWGFRYATMGVWAKQSRTGRRWAFGTGYIYRGAAEFWLVGVVGDPELRSRSVRNLIVAPVHREHSRKPDQMHDDIERLWHGPYCEVFARRHRRGWHCWGDELEGIEEAA